jgi:hypothetical protein
VRRLSHPSAVGMSFLLEALIFERSGGRKSKADGGGKAD